MIPRKVLGALASFYNQILADIASHHGKSPAQVILRWVLQKDVLPLVKSVHAERIRENLRFFDFTLSEQEMAAIDALPDSRFGSHPDTATF